MFRTYLIFLRYRAKTPSTPSDGQGLSSRANARDLRKISPFGRNDNALFLAPFAPLRETPFFQSLLHPKISNIFG
jgi:hypothetical protein